MWDKYLQKKQTYRELAQEYGCSAKTIQRRLDEVSLRYNNTYPHVANVVIDTTYFGRKFGVMCFKDSISKTFLHKQYVEYETNSLYYDGIDVIRNKGIYIQSIICDGRQGLFKLFVNIPVQMCHYHQQQIVVRYLTRKPKVEAAKELLKIVYSLSKLSKTEFMEQIDVWFTRWEKFINERTESKSETTKKRSFYTHKRLRSSYFSIKRNLPYLFMKIIKNLIYQKPLPIWKEALVL